MSFTIFQKEKTPFQGIKTRSSESRKSDIFPKGLTHGFGPKWSFFHFFFQAMEARKISFAIFQNAKTPFQAIKKRSLKSWKMDIFSKGSTHCIFHRSSQRKIGRLDHKNIDYKNSENLDFSKGVSLWFFSKNVIFLILSFCSKYAK